ncbi:MAG: 4Fe-4S dicluster domain-containing protein [Deltaproteobacteria bacterium]|nr:4Fe-4S dicluster domain-containing protein [Deltaproteobacteria bacterium]
MSKHVKAEDPLIRMQRDLARVMTGDQAKVKWIMVIDRAKCVGCHACTISCVAENKLPPGVVYRPVLSQEIGTYPRVAWRFLPRPCMQCQNPPCVKVCPVKATYQNEQGVTVIDYDICIGCRYCISACPYGARTSDFGEWYTAETAQLSGTLVSRQNAAQGYETKPAAEYGRRWPDRGKGSPIGNARKCHFCLHRLAVTMLPACVTGCIGRATYFGDRNDPGSLVRELLASTRISRLKEELGTNPSVYYLM